MYERVHPDLGRPTPQPTKSEIPQVEATLKRPIPFRSFVIQLPKDQIYRIPPPENEYHLKFHSTRASKRHRGTCRRCLAISFLLLSLFVLSFAATTGILYLIFSPKFPSFSIESLSIHNVSLSSAASSPEIDLTVRSENPNIKVGINYRHGGVVAASFFGEVLCRGAWPSFYQGKRNIIAVQTLLKGSEIRLSDDARGRLTAAVHRREIPLVITAELPMRLMFGAVRIWTSSVTLHCDVTVDKLTADARIRNRSCIAKVDVF